MRAMLALALIALLGLGALATPAHAQNRFAVTNGGNWNSTGTWSTVCGGASGSSVPVAASNVTICSGITVNVTADASVTAITLNATSGANNGIAISSGVTLDASGDITMNAPSAGTVDQIISVGDGTLMAANISIPGSGTGGRDTRVTINDGTLTISNSLNFSGTAAQAQLTVTGSGRIEIGNDFDVGGTFTAGTGTVSFNGVGGTQTVPNYTYYNLEVNNTGGGSARVDSGTTTMNGAISVLAGTLNIRGRTVTANSTTTVANGATISFTTSTAGTKIFAGKVIIESGGSWVNTVDESITLQDGLTNDGSFDSGTGTYTFNTSSQDVSGTSVIQFDGTVTIGSAVTITNKVSNASGVIMNATTGLTGVAGAAWTQDPGTTLQVRGPLLTTGGTILNASAAGNTVEYIGATNHAVKVPSSNTYYNLKTSGTSTKTMPAAALTISGDFTHNGTSATASTAGGAMTVAGNFSIGPGATFSGGAGLAHSVGGNWDNDGTFTASTSTITFTGTAPQDLGGDVATTFNNMAVDKSSNSLAISRSPTVNATLTFTNGLIATGSNVIVVGTAGSATGAAAGRYVNGCVRKNFPADAAAPFQSFTFPIGDGANYTPVAFAFTTASTVGDLTACTVTPDHPQVATPIGSTGIDGGASVNRYWTLTANLAAPGGAAATGTPTGTYDVTFTFVPGDRGELSDAQLDGSATSPVVIERYDGTNWFPTTAGTRTTTSTQATGNVATAGTSYGAYAIGVPFAGFTPVPGIWNAYETSTLSGAILGKINTRVAGLTTGNLSIVAINAGKTGVATVSTTVVVRLIDSSDNSAGGTYNSAGCYSKWVFAGTATSVSTTTPPGAGISVLPNASFPATSRINTYSFTAPGSVAFPDARLWMQDLTTSTLIGCSTDRFAIRPRHMEVAAYDGTWQTAGTARALNNISASGGVVHAAASGTSGTARPFTLQATYKDGSGNTTANVSGSYTPSKVAGSPTCGSLCVSVGQLDLGTWSAASAGVVSGTANYGEAGTVNVELEDKSFAWVDRTTTFNDGTPDSASNAVPYGATIPQGSGAPAPVEVGRFVPDHFDVIAGTTPIFKTFNSTTCAGRSFTYVGQPFGYETLPTATVIARNGANQTTVNYRSSLNLFKLTGAMITESYSAATGTLDTALKGTAELSAIGNGTATYSPSPTAVLSFVRDASPTVPFTGNITLSVSAADTGEVSATTITGNPSAAGITTTTPLAYSSIAFNGGVYAPSPTIPAGAAFVYGRARLLNATGSEQIGLTVPFRVEYYNVTGTGFTTHTADSCSSFASDNFTFISTSYSGTLSAGNMPSSNIVYTGTTLSSGIGTLKIDKPTGTPPLATGSVRLCLDLDAVAASGDTSCQAGTPADKTWLQGPWGSTNYDKDPNSRAAFGLYGAQPNNVIFMRENY